MSSGEKIETVCPAAVDDNSALSLRAGDKKQNYLLT